VTHLADFCYRKRWWVLGAWVAALVGVFALGGAFPAENRANYKTPGAEATKAYDVLAERFPARQGDSINIVFRSEAGATDASTRAVIDPILARIAKHDRVSGVISPFTPQGAHQVAADGKTAYAEVAFDTTVDELANDDADYQKKFLDDVGTGTTAGVQVEVSTFVESMELGGELIGLIFAALVLLVAFGSLVAMGLPIVCALFGLGIGATLGGVLSHTFETPDWAGVVAGMIGLGVGIDYALFIITRYRQSLDKGLTPRESVITAMGTAGRAVLFAGMTVVVSLAGMLAMGLGYLHGVVASSVVAVLAMLAASITLLPAILGFVGHNVNKLRVPIFGGGRDRGAHGFWYRWSRIVQRRPWTAFLGGAAVLLLLTIPLFSLRFGFPDDGNLPKENTARRAYDLTTSAFGQGFNNPLVVVADTAGVTDKATFTTSLSDSIAKASGVQAVSPAFPNPAGDAAIINVYPTTSPQSKQTEALVKRLRSDVIAPAVTGTGATVYVGGITAISIDQSTYITDRLPWFIGAVVLLSFLLLTTVFRSPLVALKAGIMNLLSIAAAYGVMAYAVNGTWFGRLLNINETPVPAFVPMIMFAILFGLSMDYEVFLLSRIREEYLRTGDNGLAVADGLAATARVITAAAAIMMFVFGVFIFDPNPFIKQIGLGLTTAVFVDATIVRMILVPATMELLGNANWWMPKWLGRILPEVHIEGQDAVDAELAQILAEERATLPTR
jgi:putative drug exporter of the RND superfamily